MYYIMDIMYIYTYILYTWQKAATISLEVDRPSKEEEVNQAIGNSTRNKAAGTNNMKTVWLKDLNESNQALLFDIKHCRTTNNWANKR